MKLGTKMFYFILGLLIFIACAPRAEVPPPRSEDRTTVPQAPAKEAWEKAWDEIVREAKRKAVFRLQLVQILKHGQPL